MTFIRHLFTAFKLAVAAAYVFGLAAPSFGYGVSSTCEITSNSALDCNNNGLLDECELAGNPGLDCNNNGVLDSCDIASSNSVDLNNDGIPDECQVDLSGIKTHD